MNRLWLNHSGELILCNNGMFSLAEECPCGEVVTLTITETCSVPSCNNVLSATFSDGRVELVYVLAGTATQQYSLADVLVTVGTPTNNDPYGYATLSVQSGTVSCSGETCGIGLTLNIVAGTQCLATSAGESVVVRLKLPADMLEQGTLCYRIVNPSSVTRDCHDCNAPDPDPYDPQKTYYFYQYSRPVLQGGGGTWELAINEDTEAPVRLPDTAERNTGGGWRYPYSDGHGITTGYAQYVYDGDSDMWVFADYGYVQCPLTAPSVGVVSSFAFILADDGTDTTRTTYFFMGAGGAGPTGDSREICYIVYPENEQPSEYTPPTPPPTSQVKLEAEISVSSSKSVVAECEDEEFE